jgi:hypothetical protein
MAAGSLCGCERPTTPLLPPPPPHGGAAFAVPGKGFVEVVRKDAPDGVGKTQLVVYFLDEACKPLASAPSEASFQTRGRGSVRIALKPAQDADPATAGGLASAPFDDPGEITGMLSATIDRAPVSIPITMR